MVNIIIKNEVDELKDTFHRLRNPPYPFTGMEILFENSKRVYLNNDSALTIDEYDCYIDGQYFDLRKNIIRMIIFKS